jgi:protein-S-isoprenylcysteine O-methyltransferase
MKLAATLMCIFHFNLVAGMLLRDFRNGTLLKPFRAILAYLPIFGIQLWALLRLRGAGMEPVTFYAGTAVFCIGALLRIWAISTLAAFFTMEIGVKSEHLLIQSGPYRWIRHPSYSGYLMIVIGLGFVLQSVPALVLPALETAIFLSVRIPEEERMLLKHFGESFGEYAMKTKRLIPFVF